jgi:hypothetical protein
MVVPILKLREGLLQAQKPEADAFRDTGIQFVSVTTAPRADPARDSSARV